MTALALSGGSRRAMTALAGTGTLLRLALRRDRVMLPVWMYLITFSIGSTAFAFKRLYPDGASRTRFAASIAGNGSLRALYGRLYDAGTVGGLTAWRMGVFGATLAGLLSILLVVRHTRAEEEDGRLELVGAGAVGRRAPLTAALLTALTAQLLLAVLATAVLAAAGQAFTGALAFGLALAGSGVVFAGLAAVTAQLAETARAANGLAGVALGTAFALRAAGDSGAGWVSWLSPIGWSEQVRPFAADRWWALLLPLGAAALLTAGAFTLVARRDLGAGLLPQRPGPAAAAPGLRTAGALAWRLQRGSLFGWCAGFAVGGAVFGGVAKGVADLVSGNQQVAHVFTRLGGQRGVLNAYMSSVMTIFGMIAVVYAVQAVLRLRGEETSGRAEPVLAGAVPRLEWALGHLVFPVLGSAAVLASAGVTAGLTASAVTGSGPGVGELLGAALVQLPAVWLAAAPTLVLVGLLPRYSAAGWGAAAVLQLIGWLGPILQLGQPVLNLSPFTHIPHLPGGAFHAQPLLWIAALALVLGTVGLAGLRRRDLG